MAAVSPAAPPPDLADAPAPASAPAPVSLLARLPPELLDLVLAHVAAPDRAYTAASLACVFLGAPPADTHLWRHVVVGRPAQLVPLYRRLRADATSRPERGGGRLTRTFAQQSWRGDADVLNNVLRCLSTLDTLLLNCGTNFAPEHLQEMFDEPRPRMKRMEVRFRPYVEQATYYQFLKGSYFDTAVQTLYRNWPEMPNFTHLSIVQDLPPRNASYFDSVPAKAAPSLSTSLAELSLTDASGAPTRPDDTPDPPAIKGYSGKGPFPYLSDKLGDARPKNFAQPIVFFDIRCLARFGASPVARHISHLRLRVPSRDVAYVLVSPPEEAGAGAELFPRLRSLDLSTTNARLDAVLSTLLRMHGRLEHLVLDRVNLFGFKARDSGPGLCRELGTLCVSAGLARGKERERQIAAWEVAGRVRQARADAERRRMQALVEGGGGGGGDEHEDELDAEELARREQERRDEERRQEMERNIALARSRRGHRSAGHSTFSLRDRPLRGRAAAAAAASAAANDPALPLPDQDKLYFVLPPLPTLKTLCIGGEAQAVASSRVKDWEDNFHAGWRDALGNVLGWATHVADKYERALKKADEWRAESVRGPAGAGGKGKAPAAPRARAPTDVRLYAFPPPDADRPARDPADPTVGLVAVAHDADRPRAYLDAYRDAVADAELWASGSAARPPCVLCLVPDCEGPLRRGAEGEKVDGRGGMDGVHRDGCGHMLGRREWGWDAVEG